MKGLQQTQSKVVPASEMTPTGGRMLQRKCRCGGTPGLTGVCEACRKNGPPRRTQNSELGIQQAFVVPQIVHEVLRSPSQPLDPVTRAFIEPRFGHDFSNVRVHTDAKAAESANAVSARAYTVGSDIVFGSEQYRPETDEGRRLLAHELVHLLQQSARTETVGSSGSLNPEITAVHSA